MSAPTPQPTRQAPPVHLSETSTVTRTARYRRSPSLFSSFFGVQSRLSMSDLRAFVEGAPGLANDTPVDIRVSGQDGVVITARETRQHDDAETAEADPEEKEEDREV